MRMNALKVVDIYRQLQNSPLVALDELAENDNDQPEANQSREE